MQGAVLFDRILGHRANEALRTGCVRTAILGFLLHLLLCLLYQLSLIDFSSETSQLFDSYLDALYTPFSIFLAYEVYELIRTIPDSFTNSIGKQFEIITLLVVRDILKRLSDIDASVRSTIDESITTLAVECLAFLILFVTALFFTSHKRETSITTNDSDGLEKFISQKKQLAILLLVLYILTAIYSLSSWTYNVFEGDGSTNRTIFFLDFFTVLIMADILILLVSYQHITDFSHLARNTGFILSTVILRVAIASPGISGAILFILAGCLGSAVLHSGVLFKQKERDFIGETE
ncbi:hypothetical protein N9K65_04850 [Candidatus Poseidoniales archaeon]|nr:hypothetical protein [Candidatus Poseidoniales archaeon]MDA8802044.1 hypothetical protein [Candidatus Poseidoniales archaeon]